MHSRNRLLTASLPARPPTRASLRTPRTCALQRGLRARGLTASARTRLDRGILPIGRLRRGARAGGGGALVGVFDELFHEDDVRMRADDEAYPDFALPSRSPIDNDLASFGTCGNRVFGTLRSVISRDERFFFTISLSAHSLPVLRSLQLNTVANDPAEVGEIKKGRLVISISSQYGRFTGT